MSKVPNRYAFGLGAFIFGLMTLIYLAWPNQFYGGDAIQFAVDIESDANGTKYFHPSGERLYDPNFLVPNPSSSNQTLNVRYFLEYPITTLLYKLCLSLGYSGSVIVPLIIFRAIVGGLTTFFFFLAILELRHSPLIAAVVSMGLGLTSAYWTFSTDLYQSIDSVLFIALAFYVLVRLGRQGQAGIRGKIILASVLAFATLFNILGILSFAPFALAVSFLKPNQKLVQRLREFIIFGGIYGVVIILVVGITYLIIPQRTGQVSLFSWSDSSGTVSQEVFDVEPILDIARAVLGFGQAQVMFPGITVRDFQGFRRFWDTSEMSGKIAVMLFYGVIYINFALPVLTLFIRRRKLQTGENWLWLMLPLWFFSYAVFNWFWLPSNVHYWMIPLMCWWIVVALWLSHIKDTLPRWYRPALGTVGAFVVVSFIFNFTTQFLPQNQQPNPWMEIADSIGETPSNSLYISDGHPLDFYIAYFAHRNIVSTQTIDMQSNDDFERAQVIVSKQVQLHRADDGAVYVYSQNPDALEGLAELLGLQDKQQLEIAWSYPDLTIYKANFPATT
jgi:hypothetical protein